MSRNTIDRIVKAEGRTVVIGRYSYRVNVWTGEINRCLTERIGKLWIDWEGNVFDAWETVAHA